MRTLGVAVLGLFLGLIAGMVLGSIMPVLGIVGAVAAVVIDRKSRRS